MGSARAKEILQEIVAPVDVAFNGDRPWDIRVRDERFYPRVLRDGSLGFGESYMDGWWECEDLPELFRRLIPAEPETRLRKNLKLMLHAFQFIVLNPGRTSNAFGVGERHYDIGNDLYCQMLDRRMVYSCAYWKDTASLDDAQEAKLDLICRKLGLKAGDRILDIGCGWGSLAKYASEKYGVKVVGITVSREQAKLGREMCKGLSVEIRLQDYRDVREIFDHVVSVGMFEHVGQKNYRIYMETVRRCLKEDGLFLLHTIGNSRSQTTGDIWVNRYIFPNSMLPSMRQISQAAEGVFTIEDVHNFGTCYDMTLHAWLNNFLKNWDKLRSIYDERFYRMWTYYLQLFMGAFRSRYLHVWQIVFSPAESSRSYVSVR